MFQIYNMGSAGSTTESETMSLDTLIKDIGNNRIEKLNKQSREGEKKEEKIDK